MKKPVPIDKLMRWAWVDELPKEPVHRNFLRPQSFATPWSLVSKAGELGTEVQEPDVRNRYGVAPDYAARNEPHPDAVRLWHMLATLDEELSFDVDPDWNPIADLGGLGSLGAAAIARGLNNVRYLNAAGEPHLRAGLLPSELTRRCAILGPPDWHCETPEHRYVSHDNGKPKWFMRSTVSTDCGTYEIETDGFNPKARRPHPGAYRKVYLDPDPSHAVEARLQYDLWYSALVLLAEDAATMLDDHLPLPPEAPCRPWEAKSPIVEAGQRSYTAVVE